MYFAENAQNATAYLSHIQQPHKKLGGLAVGSGEGDHEQRKKELQGSRAWQSWIQNETNRSIQVE